MRPVILREENKLQAFEERVLRKICGKKNTVSWKLGYYMATNFVICIGHIVLPGEQKRGGYDGLDM
jgi:hypothetical protein